MNQNDTPSLFMLTTFARHTRKHPTRSEALLWAQLRQGKLGVRFRRQHPMLGFIVDFYCPSAKLVVEIDGGVHDSLEAQRRDQARDAALVRFAGVRILRIAAELVERDVLVAGALVCAALRVP